MVLRVPTKQEWAELRPSVAALYRNNTADWIARELKKTRGLHVTYVQTKPLCRLRRS